MNVSPSSVSRQVAVLERQMGTKLVERSTGGVALTHAGQLVANYARSTVMEFDALKVDLDDMRGSRRRLIRVASVESVVAAGPCRAMAEFRSQFEDVTFRMTMLPAPQVVEAVKKDMCDVGLTMNPSPDPELKTLAVVSEPIVLAVPVGHPFERRKSISLEEALGGAVAAPDETFGIWRIVSQAANTDGYALKPVMVGNTFEALRDFARTSGCGALLPSRAVHNHSGEPALIPVSIDSEPLLAGAIHVVAFRARRMPRIVGLFAEALVKNVQATHC